MKLLDKYNRVNLLFTIGIFILSGVAFYFALHYTLIHQLDEDLRVEQREIIDYVKEKGELPRAVNVQDQQISFTPATAPLPRSCYITNHARPYNDHDDDDEGIRQMQFSIKVGNSWYTATVSKSLEGTNSIIRAVVVISLGTILLVLLATFVINRKILKALWAPFYQALNAVKYFKLGSNEKLVFAESNIDEFTLMNTTLQQAIGKAEQDYDTLKQFTENASHEMQTPLAIARSKMEILIQGENLDGQQTFAVQMAMDAINKLARLNQSLILLAKIENDQFVDKTTVDLQKIVTQKIEQFKELWQDKQLTITLDINEAEILINSELAELLLNNVLSNATRHNRENGEIAIMLDKTKLTVTNTGAAEALDAGLIFKRFYNPFNKAGSNGLGLAIIKQICDASGVVVEYNYADGRHTFSFNFG